MLEQRSSGQAINNVHIHTKCTKNQIINLFETLTMKLSQNKRKTLHLCSFIKIYENRIIWSIETSYQLMQMS